jgi:hypothetical protein
MRSDKFSVVSAVQEKEKHRVELSVAHLQIDAPFQRLQVPGARFGLDG